MLVGINHISRMADPLWCYQVRWSERSV